MIAIKSSFKVMFNSSAFSDYILQLLKEFC